jgi:hypothetical protein
VTHDTFVGRRKAQPLASSANEAHQPTKPVCLLPSFFSSNERGKERQIPIPPPSFLPHLLGGCLHDQPLPAAMLGLRARAAAQLPCPSPSPSSSPTISLARFARLPPLAALAPLASAAPPTTARARARSRSPPPASLSARWGMPMRPGGDGRSSPRPTTRGE